MQLLKSLLVAGALSLTPALSGCSSDGDEPENVAEYIDAQGQIKKGPINLTNLTRSAEGLFDATYTLTDYSMYHRYYGKWEMVDLADLCGWQTPYSTPMIIHEGRCWIHMRDFFISTGPTAFRRALQLLRHVRNQNYVVYVKTAIDVNADSRTLVIANMHCQILQADDNNLAVGFETTYVRGGDFAPGEEGKILHVGRFKLSAPIEFGESDLGFDSEREAYDWLISEFRTEFGESVDLNSIYEGTVILDDPIFNISDLIKERDMRS